MVGQRGQPFGRRREAVPVGQPFVLLPARADAELEATAGDDVDGGGHLGRQGRIAEPRADDHVAEPGARRDRRQRGQHRERLERDLVGRGRHGVEMVEDPEGFEPERLGPARVGD